ncbi:MAG TPA: DMT family transporter, partial [Burkholderiales bacterium]|nr:DMT family transporter [Burkholderiales bacterium]
DRHDLPTFFALALLGIVVNQVLFLSGLALTTAIDATVLVATIPAFTLSVAIMAGRETSSLPKVLGVGLAFGGVVALVGGANFGSQNFVGNAMIAANALSYSVYLVASRPQLERHDPLTLVAWTFALGALVMLPLAAPDFLRLPWSAISWTTWAGLAYIVIFPSVVTYYLNNWALKRVPSSMVANFVYLQPLVAAALAIPLLGEGLSPNTVVAAALIVLGVMLGTRSAGLPRRVAGAR